VLNISLIELKRPGLEADKLPISNAQVQNE
jgi:hypothetical protein